MTLYKVRKENNNITGIKEGVGLRPLACCDRGFESHRGHGCLSVVSVVCCQVAVSATDLSLVQRSRTDCGASLSVIKKPRMRGGYSPLEGCKIQTHNGGCSARRKKSGIEGDKKDFYTVDGRLKWGIFAGC